MASQQSVYNQMCRSTTYTETSKLKQKPKKPTNPKGKNTNTQAD